WARDHVAESPDATLALGLGQQGHRVGGAAQLVGVDRLQVLELEPHVRESPPELETNQGRAEHGAGDARPRLPDLAQGDGADRCERGGHRCKTSAAAATSSTATPTDLNSVISEGVRRPGSAPDTTAPISVTSLPAAMTSPDSRSAASRES